MFLIHYTCIKRHLRYIGHVLTGTTLHFVKTYNRNKNTSIFTAKTLRHDAESSACLNTGSFTQSILQNYCCQLSPLLYCDLTIFLFILLNLSATS